MHERPLLVADDDVRKAITIRVRRDDLRAHTRVVVDLIRDPVHGLVRAARELEPIHDRRRRRFLVATGTVCPEAFAGDDVFQAIAVDVHEIYRVKLREAHAIIVERRRRVAFLRLHDVVLGEEDFAVAIALLELLEPREAVAVRREAGDHVVQSVAVHVVGVHLRAAVRRREGNLVLLPHRIARQRLRLLPPTVLLHDVQLAVAIHVAKAVAVIEPMPFAWRGNFVERPFLVRLVPVRLRVAEVADHVRAFLQARVEEHLRLAVARDVAKRRRFVVGQIHREMLFPRTVLALRILVPVGRRAREAEHENVIPAVLVEVAGEGEEIV